MATEEELKRQYFEITQNSVDPKVHDRAYKELLVKLYRLNYNDQRIFFYLQTTPLKNGVEAFFAYLLDEINLKEFYKLALNDCIKLYVKLLLEFKLILKYDLPQSNKLYDEVIFEFVKGADTLKKPSRRLYCGLEMGFQEKRQLRSQDRVAYLGWFNALEKLHKKFGLPPVREFLKHFPTNIEPIGHRVLQVNDFSEFHLKSGEFERYKKLCQ